MNNLIPLLQDHSFAPPSLPEKWSWTQSAMKTFRNCKRMFFWKYIMRLQPQTLSDNLVIGSAFHRAVGKWYTSKLPMSFLAEREVRRMMAEFHAAAEYFDEDDREDAEISTTTFIGMLMGYADVYASDKKEWKVLEAEHRFKIDMGEFFFEGMMDLVYKHRASGRIRLAEHKTAGNITPGYINRLALDTQSRSYMFAAHQLGFHPEVIEYDVTRKCKLRRKKTESHEEFNERIALDYKARVDFYFYREPLFYEPHDLHAFEFELHQVNREFQYLVKHEDPLNPRTWGIDDQECNHWGKACHFLPMCTRGLNASNQLKLKQTEVIHGELEERTAPSGLQTICVRTDPTY